MFYKPGDKILYSRSPSGDPKGVVIATDIPAPKSAAKNCCTQFCTIKCGTFEHVVANHYLSIRVVNEVEQVTVQHKFKAMPTRRLLILYRGQRFSRVEECYSTYKLTNTWSGDFDEFFNDVGVDDYYTKHEAYKIIEAKFDRDILEMKYELSLRENIESRVGSRKMRQKIAKTRKGKGKSKNR